MKNLPGSRGFTLIELLVVCSIISLLAVIALPNFSEAQTRTKVAVPKNNLRTVSHKFELLNVDTNRYPYAGKWRYILLYQVPDWLNDDSAEDRFTKAYKSMYGPHEDIFEFEALKRTGMQDHEWLAVNEERKHLCHGFNFFHPRNLVTAIEQSAVAWDDMNVDNWKALTELAGGWVMYSPGPDLTMETPAWIETWCDGRHDLGGQYVEKNLFREYDPTNGTISYGNIFRSQKNQAGLGHHKTLHE